MKKLSQFLEVHISETPGTIYLKCGVLTVEGISTAKIVQFRKSTTKVHIRENRIIVLPVNILTGVVHRLLGPYDTLPCVLMDELKRNSTSSAYLHYCSYNLSSNTILFAEN